jgi:cytochrome c peroxidase
MGKLTKKEFKEIVEEKIAQHIALYKRSPQVLIVNPQFESWLSDLDVDLTEHEISCRLELQIMLDEAVDVAEVE